jgi:hypothetical protein
MAVQLQALIDTAILDIRARPTGVVIITMAGWQVALADVAAIAQQRVITLSRQPSHLVGNGRYGKYWWVAFAADAPRQAKKVMILGSRLRVTPNHGEHHQPPHPSQVLDTTFAV